MMRLLILLAAVPLWAFDDAGAILKRWIEAQHQNDQRGQQYTYVEDADWFTYEKDGQLRKYRSATSEVLFVEGLEYQKLVARNGKPLDAHEQARVEKEMSQTAGERRKHRRPRTPGGAISLGNQRIALGSMEEFLTLFDNRLVGEEEIRGRKAWVIASMPKAGYVPISEHEKQVFCFRKELWIDEADAVKAREILTVIGNHIFVNPGSTLTFEYEKLGPDTWHASSVILDTYRVRDKTLQPSTRTQYRLSRFQKFDVQSTITVDLPK
jgi:hypothetical protein